ncbi:MAG TPA: hypothetical protein VIT88_00735 [Pyrinomonadaceae bacterium]
MEIKFKIEIDTGKEERLVQSLGCTKAKLQEELSVYAKAALSEYVEMFCGISSVRTIGDVREQRLLQIILADDSRDLPTEPTVSRLFHMTHVQARTLLRSVFEKRDFEIRGRLIKACVEVVKNPDRSVDPIILTIKNPRVAEALNRVLEENGEVPFLQRKDGASQYSVDKNSLPVLEKYFLGK